MQSNYGGGFVRKIFCGLSSFTINKNEHPTVTTNRQNASSVWNIMLSTREVVEPHIRWLIRKGNIDGYRDSWCHTSLHISCSFLPVYSLFRKDGFPDEHKISQALGRDVLEEIKKRKITLTAAHEVCIWDLSPSGAFSLSSAWDLIR